MGIWDGNPSCLQPTLEPLTALCPNLLARDRHDSLGGQVSGVAGVWRKAFEIGHCEAPTVPRIPNFTLESCCVAVGSCLGAGSSFMPRLGTEILRSCCLLQEHERPVLPRSCTVVVLASAGWEPCRVGS